MSELFKRVAFAVPAAALFIFLAWLGEWYFKGILILIGLFVIQEMIRILDKAHTPTDLLFPYTIGLWIMLSQEIPFSFEIGLGILILFFTIQTFNSSETSMSHLTATVFAGIYAPIGILSIILINSFGNGKDGFILTMLLIVMVWGSDIFAYFGGKSFGKHALAPSISPNKTWEGFFSGYVGSAVAASLFLFAVPYPSPISIIQLVPFALLVATFGPIGDLLESKLKRKAGVKDSSSLLPGHGGFFDRFDALLLAAPVAYIYLKVLRELGNVSF